MKTIASLCAPAVTLLSCGLLLHPLDPQDALGLLRLDPIDFLLAAGLAARILLLLGAALLVIAAILLKLALFRSMARRMRYHSRMAETRIFFS